MCASSDMKNVCVIILEIDVNIAGIDVYVVLFTVFLPIHAYSMYPITRSVA